MPASPRRRALGQHFLKDEHVIAQILDATFTEAQKAQVKTLIEIGPGGGALTRPLLDRLGQLATLEKLWIVEKDVRYANFWTEQTFELREKVEVVTGDFLNVDPALYLSAPPTVVVSNLPYSSGTAILTSLATQTEGIRAMILMFQAEVAHRLRALPNEKAWGSLSLWIQNHWDVSTIVAVPPRAFSPPPDVNSEVVLFKPRSELRIPETQGKAELFDRLLRVAFAHRRKMLRSGLPKGSVYFEALGLAGIDGTRRAESLTWDEWRSWFKALTAL